MSPKASFNTVKILQGFCLLLIINLSKQDVRVHITGPTHPVPVGSNVTLKCRAQLTNRSRLHKLLFVKVGTEWATGSSENPQTIKLSRVKKNDAGEYKCSATDFSHKNRQQLYTLNIEVPPKLNMKHEQYTTSPLYPTKIFTTKIPKLDVRDDPNDSGVTPTSKGGRVFTVVDLAAISQNYQIRVTTFLDTINTRLTAKRYNSIIITTNSTSSFLNSTHNEKTLVEGMDRAVQTMPLPEADPHSFILVITDWEGDIGMQKVLEKANLARNMSTLGAVVVGVTEASKKEELKQMVRGQQSRLIFVKEIEKLENAVDETVKMICPGVPTTCSVKLKAEQSLSLNITCRSTDVSSSIILQNATANLLRCWNTGTLKSNETIVIKEDNYMNMCALDSTFRHQNCKMSATDLDLSQHEIIMILNRLDQDCIDPLSKPKCLHEKDPEDLAQNATDRINAELVVYTNSYRGPEVNLLKLKQFARVLPRWRINKLSIEDIDNVSTTLFVTLPVPMKLALTRQTLAPLAFQQVKMKIENDFQGKGCGYLGSINVSILMEPGHVSLGLAVDMCTCSEQESEHIPAKMDILCKIIFTLADTIQEFMNIQERLCALCFAYILKNRPPWQKAIVADKDMKNSACDKIGQSFILPPSVLAQWALLCRAPSKVGDCNGSRPSLMLHGPSLPSVADLAVCKDVFCHRLCHLTEAEVGVIRQTLNQQQKEDVGCLAYLDDYIPQWDTSLPALNVISGSCRLKSRVIKMAREAGRNRKKRSYSMSCGDITEDIKHGIVPSDVLDAEGIEADLGNDTYNCVKNNNLGNYHWDIKQAKTIFKHLRQHRSLSTLSNSEIEVLGFIGLGFTPYELQTMSGLSNTSYGTFGAAYGWSLEQLHTLAQRYLDDNSIKDSEPHRLTVYDLARLNHLVCGLSPEFVKGITIKTIMDSTPILGRMQRCEIEVLEVLAQILILYHGPVASWPEDHFSEFGIMLAGLSGEYLRDVVPNYVTVPVVNHIRPTEFWKLTPEQTSLFSYDVSMALSKRGLCAWLTDQHKQGYLEHLCAGAGTVAPLYICVLLLLAFSMMGRLW